MKLEQHLLIQGIKLETGNEIRTTNIDQRGMKLEQQLLTNRELN